MVAGDGVCGVVIAGIAGRYGTGNGHSLGVYGTHVAGMVVTSRLLARMMYG